MIKSSVLALILIASVLISGPFVAEAAGPAGFILSLSNNKCEDGLKVEDEAASLAKAGFEKIEIVIQAPDQQTAATFTGLIGKKGTLLTAGDFDVFDPYKRQGYGRELARRILEAYPNIQRIDSVLLADNFTEFENALEETGKKRIAVQATPSYKIWSALGFTKFWMDSSDTEVRVIFSKPHKASD